MYLMQINSNVHVGHLHLLFSTKNFIKPKTFDIWSLIRPLNFRVYSATVINTLYPYLISQSIKYIRIHMQKLSLDLGVWENIHKPPKVPNSQFRKLLDILCEPILVVSAIGNAHLT